MLTVVKGIKKCLHGCSLRIPSNLLEIQVRLMCFHDWVYVNTMFSVREG